MAVVIPCYAQARFLADALGSLRSQTTPPAEIVVVDDGSPDDVAGAAAAFPEARVVAQENRGLSGARNRGIAESDAPFLIFLDADDRLLPHAIQTHLAWMEDHPGAAFCWGFNRPFRDDGGPVNWGPTSFSGVPGYAPLLEENVVGSPLGVLFRRDAVEASGGFAEDAAACEDWEIYLRLARDHDIGCVGRVVAEYRHHGENMSSKADLMYSAALDVLHRQERWVAGNPSLERALAKGRRNASVRYGVPARIAAMREAISEGRWLGAGAAALDMVLRSPSSTFRATWNRLRGG